MYKLKRRATTIGLNVVNSLAVPFFNAAVSFLVIRLNSDELWGAFVSVMIVVQFGAHLASWGNKEYLLREFSRHPDQIMQNWLSSLITRLILSLGLCILLLLFGYGPQRFILAVLWGLGIVIVQSFEVFVVYRKAFLFDTVVKAISIAGMVMILLLVGRSITIDGLLALFALSYTVQSVVYTIRFPVGARRALPKTATTQNITDGFETRPYIDLTYFRLALPFFLLGFSGLLASRIDLYTINLFLTEREVGQYQVFINLMIYLQAVSNFIMLPFVKNIYRMQDSTIYKIAARLFILGMMIIFPATLVIYGLLLHVYHIEFTAMFMLLGALFALPIYGYIPLIHRLYKNDTQSLVLWVNLFGAGANFVLNVALLPVMGMIAAILASSLVQWGMLGIYLLQSGRVYGHSVSKVSSGA